MKKCTVEFLPGKSPATIIYGSNYLSFTWVDRLCRDKYKQLTNWHQCRETFISEISRYFKDSPGFSLSDNSFRKMRFCIFRKYSTRTSKDKNSAIKQIAHDEKSIISGAHFLNTIERFLGWSLTSIKKVDYKEEEHDPSSSLFVVLGSVKWMRSPQLLSLYLLIIRLGVYNEIMNKLDKIEDFDLIKKNFKNVLQHKNKSSSNKKDFCLRDATWLGRIDDYFLPILKNVDTLFFKRSMKENYLKMPSNLGIDEMINGKNIIKEIRNEWDKILKI
jgi:hypothetical protein